MKERREFSAEKTESRLDDCSTQEVPLTLRKKKKNRNKRRFSDEQVKSLETIFESETKLEPRKKVQVARDLGLLPQQVAIWFQNKRARWKSKQMEKNFRILRANFDHLMARYKSMKEEKESLHAQLQELNNVLQRTQDGSSHSKNFSENSLDKDQACGQKVAAFEPKPRIHEEPDHLGVTYSDDDKCRYMASLGQEEPEPLNIDEHVCGNLVPQLRWCSFDSCNLFDQPTNSSYWWDSLS